MAAGKYVEWLEEDGLGLLKAWANEGLSYAEMAGQMQISESTLREWRAKYPPIAEAIKYGRAHAIARVENALQRRAEGYTIEVRKAIKVKRTEYDPTTQRRIRETEEIVAGVEDLHVPADTTAQIFYLTNRHGEVWKRNGAEHKDDVDGGEYGVIILPEARDGEA